jgi:hypothetical protein
LVSQNGIQFVGGAERVDAYALIRNLVADADLGDGECNVWSGFNDRFSEFRAIQAGTGITVEYAGDEFVRISGSTDKYYLYRAGDCILFSEPDVDGIITISWNEDCAGSGADEDKLVAVNATDDPAYLAEQTHGYGLVAWNEDLHGASILAVLDNAIGHDQLRYFVPFNTFYGWNAAADQVFTNGRGKVQWTNRDEFLDRLVAVDEDNTPGYLYPLLANHDSMSGGDVQVYAEKTGTVPDELVSLFIKAADIPVDPDEKVRVDSGDTPGYLYPLLANQTAKPAGYVNVYAAKTGVVPNETVDLFVREADLPADDDELVACSLGDTPGYLGTKIASDGTWIDADIIGAADDEQVQIEHLTPDNPSTYNTLGAAAEGDEAADSTTALAGDSGKGIVAYVLSRIGYFESGDEKLYMYVRPVTIDACGHIYSIGAETRIEVDAPEACT